MRVQKSVRLAAVTAAVLVMSIPGKAHSADSFPASKAFVIRDVSLDSDGCLHVQALDVNAKPQSRVEVVAVRDGNRLETRLSDGEGRVVFSNLRGGLYEISTPYGSDLIRVWSHGTAPPVAIQEATVSAGGTVVRGQPNVWRRMAIIGGVVVTSGLIGGVIGYNVKDDAS